MTRLKDLPAELLLEIAEYLELLSDINALSQTDSSFHSLCDPILYKEIRTRVPKERGDDQPEGPRILEREEGPLEWAAENGRHACARRLLQAGVPVWPSDSTLALPPIATAAKRGDLEMVKTLISHHPAMLNEFCLWSYDTHDSDFLGHGSEYVGTPLAYAIANGHDSVVEFLIESGATLRFPDEPHPSFDGEPYFQPLEQAITMGQSTFATRLLLANRHIKEHYDVSSAQALLPMAAIASFDMFKVVMDAGSLPELDNQGFWATVLDRAIASGKAKTVKFLFEYGIRISMDATEIWNPNSWGLDEPDNIFSRIGCAWENHRELTTFLLQQISIDDVVHGSSLHALICTIYGAVNTCDEALLRRLLQANWTNKKPYINQKQWLRWLEDACIYPVIESENPGILNMLNISLDYGAPVTWEENMTGSPPIIVAANKGKYEIVKTLLERGGEPKYDPGYNGQKYDLVTLLHSTLEAPFIGDDSQEKLDQRHKIVQLIMERGIDGKGRSQFHDRVFEYCIDLRYEPLLATLDEHHWLPIDPERHQSFYRRALLKPNSLMIKRFLEAGFDPNHCASDEAYGDNYIIPLSFLGDSGDPTACSVDEYTTAVSILLEYGADLEKRHPISGLTPLFHLVRNRNNMFMRSGLATRVQVLLEKGANLFSYYNGALTLIEMASMRQNIAVVKVILEFIDKQNIPFEKVKRHIEGAIRSSSSRSMKVKNVLSRWYWRKQNL